MEGPRIRRSGQGLRPEVAEEGELWSVRARDWAEVQEKFLDPCYLRVLERAGLAEASAVLDIGCGAGRFLQLAAGQGLAVTGIDASLGLLEVARTRVPSAELHLGDMESLPFEDDLFDLVTGFNSFSHAGDPVRALRETGRVAKPGAKVVLTVWGPEEPGSIRSAVSGVIHGLLDDDPGEATEADAGQPGHERPAHARPEIPADDVSLAHQGLGAPEPGGHESHIHSITAEDDLQDLVREANLRPMESGEVECRFVYPDKEVLLRGLTSPGPFVEAGRTVGEQKVQEAILAAMEKFRTASGEYASSANFRYLIASPEGP